MLHRMRSRFSDMIAMSQERRSKRSNARVRRMIAMHGRCVARQTWDPRRSSREISAWSMYNDYPDKHRKCSRPASLIANFSLTKRAQGYLFDVLKVFFFSHQFVQTCASMSVCIYVLPRGLTHGPLRGAKQIGGLDLKNNQWTPRVHCWEGVISLILFVHLHTWFEYVWILTFYNAIGVDVGCALSWMDIVAYAKSLQDNWGRQKAVVLTDRCEKIEPLRLHPWIGRFAHAFMQAIASICFRPALFFQGSALGSWANASRV